MTKQPRKQRQQDRDRALHERHSQLRATLSDDLREEYEQRNVRVNAGDTVEILRGDAAGEEAEVLSVDLKEETVAVEDVTIEKADGEETPLPLDASNLRVVSLDLDDDRRRERLEGSA